MSKEADKKIIKMEKDIEYIRKQLDKMPTLEGMKLANQELVEEVFEKTDKKYASKAIEKVVWGTAGIIFTAVLYSVLGLVIK